MKNNIIQRVVILGSIAIIGIIAIQSYWVMQTWNQKENEFSQTINIALLNVARQVAKLNQSVLPDKDLINRATSNYYVVNVNSQIDANELEHFLQKEFEAVAMKEDFEYGIFDCSSDKMVYGNYILRSHDEKRATLGDLPTYKEFTYYFGVRFPNRTSYVLNTMWLTIVFSGLLLVAIFFFIYSMFVILRQKQLSEMQKDFINNMTHEFKTPISTINISSDMFLNNPTIKEDARLLKYAQIIKDQNVRLNNQVEKVLQLAKIEKDNFKLHVEEIDLHELLEEILPSIDIKINNLNGSLNCEQKAENSVIKADRVHLTNIIHNLLDNAIKYCKDKPDVTIKTENQGDKLVFSVVDKGIGIAKQYQKNIFNKFYRVPTGNVHNVKGFGLGLFYVKSISEEHGWKVKLESEENVGTTISIYIKK